MQNKETDEIVSYDVLTLLICLRPTHGYSLYVFIISVASDHSASVVKKDSDLILKKTLAVLTYFLGPFGKSVLCKLLVHLVFALHIFSFVQPENRKHDR